MKESFKEKFKNKTQRELQFIVDNGVDYQPSAIAAAQELLDQGNFPKSNEYVPLPEKRKRRSNFLNMEHHMSIKPFLKTLGRKTLMTNLALGFALVASNRLLYFYSDEPNFQQVYNNSLIISMALILLMNHLLYRYEHCRSNNYIGRVMNTSILFLIFISLRLMHDYLLGSVSLFEGDDIGYIIAALIFGPLLFGLVFELLTSLINLPFSYSKWQPF